MDDLERQLKNDAADIDAQVSPELARRIEASLHAAERAERPRRAAPDTFRLWLLSSATGAAAALLVIAMLWRFGGATGPEEVQSTANIVPEVPPTPAEIFQLNAETAEFTGPLEDELENLRSDFEKARQNVEQDLRGSF